MWSRTAFATAWIALVVVGIAQAGCQGGVRVLSSSMEPTLHCAKPADRLREQDRGSATAGS